MLRYRFRLHQAFTPLAEQREMTDWLSSIFGRRSCRKNRQRTRSRILFSRLDALKKRHKPRRRPGRPPLLYMRLRDAALKS